MPSLPTALKVLPLGLMLLSLSVSAEEEPISLPTKVITASRTLESKAESPATIQVFTTEQMQASGAATVTEFLTQNAVGFFSQWTPAQTSINIRGAASDGQGRDFRSGILVLFDGRRAGTANLSKLSLDEIERIEIIRGPYSVLYGSQAMGAVINLIPKHGGGKTGGMVRLMGGSFDRSEGALQVHGKDGSVDFFAGVHGSRRGDYESGSESFETPLLNTAFGKLGYTLSAGWSPFAEHRVEARWRADGIYNAGFRGSSWDLDNDEERTNESGDVKWMGIAGEGLSYTAHFYHVRDVDNFRWGSEAAGMDEDNNVRIVTADGLKLYGRYDWAPENGLFSNRLLAGVDVEYSTLRNNRYRIPVARAALRTDGTLAATRGDSVSWFNPYDVNSNSSVLAAYVEEVLGLWEDRIKLRGGLRHERGEHGIVATPPRTDLVESQAEYESTTYSAGASVSPVPGLTLRGGISQGFRAPDPSELALQTTFVLGGVSIPNPDLEPEKSFNEEVGLLYVNPMLSVEASLFRNTITDQIIGKTIAADTSTRVNNDLETVVEGLEGFSTFHIDRMLGENELVLSLSLNGIYHFNFDNGVNKPAMDESGSPLDSVSHIPRMYEYQGATTLTAGWRNRFSVSATGVLRGPMWYQSEEALIWSGYVRNTTAILKEEFWLFHLGANFRPTPRLEISARVLNVLDVNNHDVFIALNKKDQLVSTPASSNGGRGNSLPGREFQLGARFDF